MADVPSNLIPTRITQLPTAPVADENSLMMIVYQGNNYQIRVGDLLSVAGVPTTRQVIAGTGLQGGGQLSSNVTLSIAPGGVGSTELANSGVTPGVYGNATNVPVFTVDSTGRVTAATTIPATVSGYVPTTRQVIAGAGLSGGGALNTDVTLTVNLSNATPQSGFQSGSAGVSTDVSRADHKHPAVDLGVDDEVDGVLGLNNGGTAKSIVPDEGAIIWCGADGLYVGPVGSAGQVLQSTGVGEYIWVNQSTLDVGQADNLNGGAANQVPYQTATGVTGFISAPTTTDTFLKWDGSQLVWGALPGGGTVTSVGLALPSEFTVTGSPVTSSGTLTGAWANQNANVVLAGPTTGAAATPAFRALVNDDLPNSGVSANTYGSSTAVPVVTVNAKGIITGVTTAAIVGGLDYQGAWNASTNTPTLASGVGTNGHYYVVSVAGSTNLDGVTDWQIGDWAIFNGAAWQKIDQTNLVSSVNGQTGAVVLTTTNVSEGTNEYFTTTRARASVSAGTAITYDSGTGVITNALPDQTVVLTAGTGISTSGTYPNFTIANTSPSLGGDVVGPASATDNAVARYDATTGKLLQNSVVLIGDTGSVTGVNALTAESLTVNNNATLGSSNTDTLDVNSRITTDLEPNANNAKDIGTSGRNWRDGFFGRTLHTVNLELTGTTSFDGSQGTSGQVLTSAGTGNTPTWTTPTVGTVTSVGGTGTVNGITLTGTVTSSGNLTLGGTLDLSAPPTIGNATPNTGAFTDFTASGTASFTSTGAVKVPVGTVAQRPTPAAGMLRFNDDSDEFEGYNGTVWASVGGSAITNDTSTATDLYPSFLNATSGTASNLYTSNAKLLYKPSTGELKSTALVATNGIVVNSATVNADYTIPSGSNAVSAGPVTVASGVTVTVSAGSVWAIV